MNILVLMKLISKNEELNEADLSALEIAVRVREKLGGLVTVLGVHEDEDMIYLYKEAFARGADKVVVYVGKELKNDDIIVSARILEKIIRSMGNFDLILTGERSMDTSFGVMGSILSGLLGMNNVYGVYEVSDFSEDKVKVVVELKDMSLVEVKIPCIVSVMREAAKPRIPTVKEKIAARKKQLEIHSASDIPGLNEIVSEPKISLLEISKPVEPERKRMLLSGEEGLDKIVEVITEIVKEV